ncbi:MAG: hypothetical protein GF364_14165 [Candidatus Lokiarchaeota archaeon]|nr:hypothetical protein [Candidatus Lokiarchaeota archaeon]
MTLESTLFFIGLISTIIAVFLSIIDILKEHTKVSLAKLASAICALVAVLLGDLWGIFFAIPSWLFYIYGAEVLNKLTSERKKWSYIHLMVEFVLVYAMAYSTTRLIQTFPYILSDVEMSLPQFTTFVVFFLFAMIILYFQTKHDVYIKNELENEEDTLEKINSMNEYQILLAFGGNYLQAPMMSILLIFEFINIKKEVESGEDKFFANIVEFERYPLGKSFYKIGESSIAFVIFSWFFIRILPDVDSYFIELQVLLILYIIICIIAWIMLYTENSSKKLAVGLTIALILISVIQMLWTNSNPFVLATISLKDPLVPEFDSVVDLVALIIRISLPIILSIVMIKEYLNYRKRS